MTATTVQRALAAYLRRAGDAVTSGDATSGDVAPDERRARSAAALTRLASWVERLPPDDERLVALAELPGSDGHRFRPGEEAQWMVWRYGTGWIEEDRDAWLHRLIDVCRSESVDTERRVIDLTDAD